MLSLIGHPIRPALLCFAAVLWFSPKNLVAQYVSDQFEDVSTENGFNNFYYSWGSSWGDPNGDGLPDLFVSNHFREKDRNIPLLFFQTSSSFFQDTLPDFFPIKDMHGSAWMDFDEDGDDDLYLVTGRTSGNLLLINDGLGGLTNQTDSWGLNLLYSRGRTPIWYDANRDGLLDMVVTNGNPISPVNRKNTLLIRGEDSFTTSLVDSLSWMGGISGSGVMIGDPWGLGWCPLGLFTDKSLHWLLPGCLPMPQQYRWNQSDLEQVIPGDFNGDGLTDLYLVRADLSQANVSVEYPINYKESFDINLINPSLTSWLGTPINGTGLLNSDGTLTYTPAAGFIGSDSLALRVCDSFGVCKQQTIYLEVTPSPAIEGAQPFAVKADSSRTLNISKIVHPYRHSLRLILYPRDSLHQAIRFHIPSDSLLILSNPESAFPSDSIFIGSTGIHPESSTRFLLTKTDVTTWGSIAYVPGASRAAYLYYEPATDEWVIAFNSSKTDQRLDLFGFSPNEATLTSYFNFSADPILTSDQLLLSNGFEYEDKTSWAGLDAPNHAVAGAAADFDNDGDLDLFLSCGLLEQNQPNILWENQGDGSFVAVSQAGGTEGPAVGSGGTPSVIDYDGDGFQDLFLENGRGNGSGILGPYTLLHNRGNDNNWLRIQLEGRSSPKEAVGAILEASVNGKKIVRVATGGQNRYSQSERVIHFGLGTAEQVDSMLIRWPSGILQYLPNIPANQVLEVKEPLTGTPTSCLQTGQLTGTVMEDSGTVEFSWMKLPCLIAFQMETRNTVSGLNVRYRLNSNEFSLPDSIFTPDVEYAWKVRSVCLDSTYSNWSTERMFMVPAKPVEINSIEPTLADRGRFRLVPNPANRFVELYGGEEPGEPIQVGVSDMLGNVLIKETFLAGNQRRIDLEKLPTGSYSVQIHQGQNTAVLKLVRITSP